MSSSEDGPVGGTRIRRPSPPPPQQHHNEQHAAHQQMAAQQQMAVQQQMAAQQQMADPEYLPPPPRQQPRQIRRPSFSKFGSTDFKNAALVVAIFVLLNSKIVWSQILKLPFMGGFEPSILALVVNSILAGIVFYFVSNVLK